MPPTDDLRLTHHTSSEAAKLMDELCEVYADAYGAAPGGGHPREVRRLQERARAAQDGVNYSLVTARIGDQVVGFAFGYSLRLGQGWWDGLKPEPSEGFTLETGSRTVVLSEIEVRRIWQGKGIGRMVHDAFLSQRTEERATLAGNPKATDTLALYECWGWRRAGIVPGTPEAYYREYVLFTLQLPHATAER